MSSTADNEWGSWSARTTLMSFFYTGLFCLAIVVLLQALGAGGTWMQTTYVSFSIGMSINAAFMVLMRPMAGLMNPYFAPIPITAIGLGIGLVLGGWLSVGRPLFFFQSEGYGTVALGVFFGVLGFMYFTTRWNLVEARARLADQERLQAETELKLLQAQIEPHFLFNTLSNVVSLIHKDPDTAEQTLMQLTQFLRASLRRTRQTTSRLADELQIVEAYLAIQQVRLGDRLQFDLNVEDALHTVGFPPLLLQPLVENAVIHGIEPSETGGQIDIRASRDEDVLTLVIEDNGVGLDANQPPGSNVGLSNVRDRLASLYGESAALELVDNQPHGLRVTLRIPVASA